MSIREINSALITGRVARIELVLKYIQNTNQKVNEIFLEDPRVYQMIILKIVWNGFMWLAVETGDRILKTR